jgi:hypothetical protein
MVGRFLLPKSSSQKIRLDTKTKGSLIFHVIFSLVAALAEDFDTKK